MLMLMQTITHIKEIITLPGPDTVVEIKSWALIERGRVLVPECLVLTLP